MAADEPDPIEEPTPLRWLDPESGLLVGGMVAPRGVATLTEAQVDAHLQAQEAARLQRMTEQTDNNQLEAAKLYHDLVDLGLPEQSAEVLARLRFKDVVL